MAVTTGITVQLGRTGCASATNTAFTTPAFSSLPEGCKVANGAGVVVALAAAATLVAVAWRRVVARLSSVAVPQDPHLQPSETIQ